MKLITMKRVAKGVTAKIMCVAVAACGFFMTGIEAKAHPFRDVAAGAWYNNDVEYAYSAGLINGKSADIFDPDANMTVAEAVKLASVMYEINVGGSSDINAFVDRMTANASPWYANWAAYAREKGIVTEDYNYNANISRADYMDLFSRALSDSDLGAVNTIADGAIRDVPATHRRAAGIYKLYRAGVVQGNEQHLCLPEDPIRRSEVSAVLTRMMYPALRIRFDINDVPQQTAPAAAGAGPFNVPSQYGRYTQKTYALVTDADYYVATNGSDSNDGSENSPFRTFERAVRAAQGAPSGGVKIAFKAGDYGALNLNLVEAHSGSATAPVTFCKYGDGEVVFSSGGGYALIGMYRTSYVNFVGLTFRGGSSIAIATNESRNITIDDCTFTGFYNGEGYALDFTEPNNITVKNCTFNDLTGGAVKLQGDVNGAYQSLVSAGNVVDNNLFSGFSKGGTSYNVAAVLVNNVAGTRISHNEFKDAQWCAVRYLGVDTLVEQNVIHDVVMARPDYGLIYTGRTLVDRGGVVRNNLIYNGNMGVECYGVYLDDGVAGQTVNGNIFYNAGSTAVVINGGRDNNVSDNIIIDTSGTRHAAIYTNCKYHDAAASGGIGSMDSWTGLIGSMSRAANIGAWTAKFPAIASMSLDPSDINNPNCVVNPTGSSVTNNFFFGNCYYAADGAAGSFIGASNNQEHGLDTNPIFADPASGNYSIVSGFANIPYSQIGRY